MSKKVYKTSRKYQCPFCDKKLSRMDLITHVERNHEMMIPESYSATRVVYDSINKTDHGTCMICKKPVYDWNEKISRYNNLCGSKKCREEVRRIALERHIKVYNKPTLLDDPAHQEKMLSSRHISGTYNHTDGSRITFTGKYEKAAVEFMDKVLNIPSKDIQMPGPILEYEYDGKKHSWITDIYYIPANLIIEVKDGGDNPNNREMPEYRGKQLAKEVMITDLGKFNYLRLTNNNFSQLLEALADIKYENMDQSTAPQVKSYINESAIINEEVGGLPPRRATANWIEPCMMKNTGFDTYAFGNDSCDTMFVGGLDDELKSITKEEYFKDYQRSGEALIYKGDDSTEIFKNLMNGIGKISEAFEIMIGHKFRGLDELAIMPNWYYFNYNEFEIQCEMTRIGVIRENDINSGKLKNFDLETPIKGSVILSKSDRGYFVHTPKDYYLASDFYGVPEQIPQNIIDTMADLYDQYKERVKLNG